MIPLLTGLGLALVGAIIYACFRLIRDTASEVREWEEER